ncbi:MAG: biopolymer transporter ExbD [Acidobacteriota bacterium]|jgi:Biopolymer transport protein|nr:biopolymer transporter ExbD [Acidobacteriota bacterium]OQB54372.1 MAG: Biopolymer transport protein ExbD [Candidatus Aminicenantes bacterium ADurb.Bin147]HNQ80432.1 biopolymer transporter ExbD [Candidatus Aminicenantes bacterium]MDD8009608.1 biopolymer transporter ExbD [Acidobacteriota bacterium]MDD8028443.1 biopolymer transporter ExbD [Acidobacteriota bacterium]
MAKAEPNVVPLCDVLLVLLIIFMVITPMVQKGIDVRLPEVASEGSGGQPAGLIVCTLNKDLTVNINNENYPGLQNAGDELRRLYSTRSDKTIFLRADVKLPFSKVVDLIDVCKGAGVDTLGLVPEMIDE